MRFADVCVFGSVPLSCGVMSLDCLYILRLGVLSVTRGPLLSQYSGLFSRHSLVSRGWLFVVLWYLSAARFVRV